MCAVFTPLLDVRRAGSRPRRHRLPSLPTSRRAGGSQETMPALRQARLPACRNRVVWPVLPSRSGHQATTCLCGLRAVAAA
jgi:hypothetical protein